MAQAAGVRATISPRWDQDPIIIQGRVPVSYTDDYEKYRKAAEQAMTSVTNEYEQPLEGDRATEYRQHALVFATLANAAAQMVTAQTSGARR